ncbi:hypothetical protein UA08_02855 [Talaromyces atroroseus]|uniref:Uncharacterized protein n=1 Tax=Talaromyces atroroseus TaxID=1441469 RepID=A0A225AU04_TALAT|nr:hypothetical protein UA08_02855 [Talaromyces atroroseus]OKL61844.1 hypothetical protein UA08_02855 [Talaromyces atroroseus]
MANFDAFNDTFDFGSFIHYPEENMEPSDFQLPTMDTSVESMDFSDMQLYPETNPSPCGADFNLFDTLEYPACDLANGTPFTAETRTPAPQAEDFRYAIDSWASADHRLRSTKQKRRDAAIDLHLQRFMNDHCGPQLFPTDSEASPSATPSITSSHQSPGDSTPVSSASNTDQSTGTLTGGRELVFDMNLNTATQLPKKQKKRTKAQIEDYINARRNGACIKHKKQHKKCNCHEKRSAKTTADVKVKRQKLAVSGSGVPTPELIPNNTPSSLSVSSFSQSPLSQLDNVLFGDDIDTALASLPDLYSYKPLPELDAQLPMENVLQNQYAQKGSAGSVSTTHHHPASLPRSPSNLLLGSDSVARSSNVLLGSGSSANSPARDAQSQGSLQIGPSSGLNTAVENAKSLLVRRRTSGNLQTTGPRLDVVSDLHGVSEGSSHRSPEHGALAGASSGLQTSGLVVQSPILSLPVSPLSTIQTQLPTAVSETANSATAHSTDVQSATVVAQTASDLTASLYAMEWISRLSTSMAMQTMQVILACRPQLFQFLSEQATGADSSPFSLELSTVQTVSAGLIGCA